MMEEGQVAIEGSIGKVANQQGDHLNFLYGMAIPEDSPLTDDLREKKIPDDNLSESEQPSTVGS